MTPDQVQSLLQLDCKELGEGLLFVQSPLTLAFDGNHLGAYLQDLGSGRYRLSDNAETLFTAMAAGMAITSKRRKQLKVGLQVPPVELSSQGELFCVTDEEALSFVLARFFESQTQLSCLLAEWLPISVQEPLET
ncbi:protein of unknown function DUF1828 [Marinospirillum celere]|uniref:DUF1828 domain-containing protein n=1 Tax=Marinospirillum celere TaxID=1122252 RepID=A0A1I1ETB8_9GAMM|nr:DUF1828 domain-containing protein [Marinospirillum celere]SFB88768.1 protein of unknown function DUF1828 [Marinospirillum celere]